MELRTTKKAPVTEKISTDQEVGGLKPRDWAAPDDLTPGFGPGQGLIRVASCLHRL